MAAAEEAEPELDVDVMTYTAPYCALMVYEVFHEIFVCKDRLLGASCSAMLDMPAAILVERWIDTSAARHPYTKKHDDQAFRDIMQRRNSIYDI